MVNMSTNTTPPTASELLAEWKQPSWVESKFANHQDWRDRRKEVHYQLDQMCEDAGISIDGGVYFYRKMGEICNRRGYAVIDIHGHVLGKSKQQALQEWLLIRDK
jgi:hypothetical protein